MCYPDPFPQTYNCGAAPDGCGRSVVFPENEEGSNGACPGVTDRCIGHHCCTPKTEDELKQESGVDYQCGAVQDGCDGVVNFYNGASGAPVSFFKNPPDQTDGQVWSSGYRGMEITPKQDITLTALARGLAEQVADCWETHYQYENSDGDGDGDGDGGGELDMNGQSATDEVDAAACMKRCGGITDCAHFTYKSDGKCHVQGSNAQKGWSYNSISGPSSCGQEYIVGYTYYGEADWAEGVSSGASGSLQECADRCTSTQGCKAFARVSDTTDCVKYLKTAPQAAETQRTGYVAYKTYSLKVDSEVSVWDVEQKEKLGSVKVGPNSHVEAGYAWEPLEMGIPLAKDKKYSIVQRVWKNMGDKWSTSYKWGSDYEAAYRNEFATNDGLVESEEEGFPENECQWSCDKKGTGIVSFKSLINQGCGPGLFTCTNHVCEKEVVATFKVKSGPCTLADDGKCVQSKNYGSSHYGNGENCEIVSPSEGTLTIPEYNAERNYDYIKIDGITDSDHDDTWGYKSTSSSTVKGKSLTIANSVTIHWKSDGSVTRDGWKICMNAPGSLLQHNKSESSSR
jgi:hypothetical protein